MTDSDMKLEMNAIRKSKRKRVTHDEAKNQETHGHDQHGLPRWIDRRFCPHCHEEVSLKTFKYSQMYLLQSGMQEFIVYLK